MIFIQNKYYKWYDTIITRASQQERNKSHSYFERHHIIPRSLGGTDAKSNIVILTAREHYICHLLLTKCVVSEGKLSMVRAWHILTHVNGIKFRSSKMYQTLRETYAEGARQNRIGKKHSELTKSRISENHADVSGKLNPNFGKTTSEYTKNKISKNKKRLYGADNPMFGKTHSDYVKQTLSEHGQIKWTPEMKHKLKIARSPGTVVTPWGEFITYKDACKHPLAVFVDPVTIKRKCSQSAIGFALLSLA